MARLAMVLAMLLVGLVTGCGSDRAEPELAAPAPELTPIEPLAAPIEVQSTAVRPEGISGTEAQVITLRLMEYVILPTEVTAKPGPIRIIAQNNGAIRHKVEIEGKVKGEQFLEDRDLPVGEYAIIDLVLDEGEYEIYCPIPGHEGLGMKSMLVVS